MKHHGDIFAVAEVIRDYKLNSFIDPEMALCGLNTISRKAEQVTRGKITKACILASEGVRDRAIYRRAAHTYDIIKGGKTVADATRILDEERRDYVERRGSAVLSAFTGRTIALKFTRIMPHGRRTDKFTERYWGFDSNVAYDVSIDGTMYHIDNLSGKEVPDFALKGKNRDNPDWPVALFCGAVLTQELQYIGHTIINITVPAAVAGILGMDADDAATRAEDGAFLTRAIPGAGDKAKDVARLAQRVFEKINEPFPPS
jgi:methylthioribose-1-phosphate isomerase